MHRTWKNLSHYVKRRRSHTEGLQLYDNQEEQNHKDRPALAGVGNRKRNVILRGHRGALGGDKNMLHLDCGDG